MKWITFLLSAACSAWLTYGVFGTRVRHARAISSAVSEQILGVKTELERLEIERDKLSETIGVTTLQPVHPANIQLSSDLAQWLTTGKLADPPIGCLSELRDLLAVPQLEPPDHVLVSK